MRGKLFWTLTFGLAGLLANLATVEIHGGAVFYFGGIFSLASAIMLGPLLGAAAAVIACLPLVVDGDLALASLFVSEAAVVGLWVRRQLVPLTADLAYWAVGSPLLLALMALEGGGWSSGAWVPALHAPVNGALCAVTADLLLLLWTTRVPGPQYLAASDRLPLRRHLVPWLVLVTLLPILATGLSAGRERAQERTSEAEASLKAGTEALARLLSSLITEHLRAVAAVAQDLTLDPPSEITRMIARLDAVRLTYGSLTTLLVADRRGEIMAGSPALRAGKKWWTGSVAERDYFKVPMASGRPYASDVFLGRGYASAAIIGLSAPIFDSAGKITSVVEASMDVRRLQLLATPLATPLVELVVVDRRQRVLFAIGEAHYQPLIVLDEPQLAKPLAASERGSLRWNSEAQTPGPMLATWRPVEAAGWRVIGMMRSQRSEQAAARVYLRYATGMLLAVILTTFFASAITSRITGPLERLVEALRGIGRDSLPRSVPAAATTAPREIADLVDNFNAMASRLEHSYLELRQSLDEREALNWELEQLLGDLDDRVHERTQELAASRREAVDLQKQFRGLLDDIEAVVCEYDLKSDRFTFVSQRVTQILGFPPEAWYEDKLFWLRQLPRAERARAIAKVQYAVNVGKSYVLEHTAKTASGEIKWLRNVGRVLRGEDDTRLLRCIMLDITSSRKAQEDQLRRRQLESVGTLAGGIAHDFNNLLTAILGNLSLAKLEVEEGARSGDVLEILDQIELAGEDARRLSHQLLTFAKGGRPIRRRCDLAPMLLGLPDAKRAAGVEVKVQLAEDLPLVHADQQQLAQVISELVHNAEQALPDGGHIEVTAWFETLDADSELPLEPGGFVAITVSDRGVGVSEELISKVFDPYFTTREAGRGFGLATTYSIMKNHGGHIAFQSTPGQGTRVTLWLPAVGEEDPIVTTPGQPFSAQPGRLLLMDDEPSVRLVAGRMLERLGWRVTITSDGGQAVEAFRRAHDAGDGFDAVLTDLTVPGGMGGADTMRELLRIDSRVRAIVCSGYSNDPVMASYREHGFVGVMTKPFSLDDLRRGLDQAMSASLPEG